MTELGMITTFALITTFQNVFSPCKTLPRGAPPRTALVSFSGNPQIEKIFFSPTFDFQKYSAPTFLNIFSKF